MRLIFDPFRLLLISLASWFNQHQHGVIDHLKHWANSPLPNLMAVNGQRELSSFR
jgi:hypothetical protein